MEIIERGSAIAEDSSSCGLKHVDKSVFYSSLFHIN